MTQRILFLTPGLTRGGAETQLLKVASHLKRQNKEVLIVALRPFNNFEEQLKEQQLNVVILKSWKTHFVSNIRKLIQTVRQFKPETVVAFMFIAIIFARLLKLKFKFHLISSIRNSAISTKWRKAFQITSGLDDLVIYNSKTSQSNFEQQKLVKKRGLVINNAIRIPPLSSIVYPESEKFVWVTMAHFRPSKDYMTLFKAIALLKDFDFRIDVLGHVRDQKWPFETVEQLGIQDKVRILGFRSDAIDFLKEADAFVLSSFWEGSPNAMLEAMAHCKPIIGSRVDGIEELLTEVDCGFLFKQGNAEELAEKMLQIMKMTVEERRTLGRAGRVYVELYFSEEQILDKWLKAVG